MNDSCLTGSCLPRANVWVALSAGPDVTSVLDVNRELQYVVPLYWPAMGHKIQAVSKGGRV
jgi:hypothetical protein